MSLDFSKEALPLYVQLRTIIKNRILDGTYAYGDLIPSESEFERQHNISRITVRRAISDLEKEGYVIRSRGKGTHVIYNHNLPEQFNRIRSFTDEMKHFNMKAGTSFLEVGLVIPPKEVQIAFDLEPDEKAFCLKRVRTGNGKPIVYFENYFPTYLDLPIDDTLYKNSVYTVLNEKGIMQPVRAIENFKARNADEDIAKKLCVAKGDATLIRTRYGYNRENELIEYTIAHYRGDIYSFSVELTE